jgi:hypothetical protein
LETTQYQPWQLWRIFTRKFKKLEATNGPPAPQKTAANKRQNSQPQIELTSPIKQNHQQTSRTNVNQAFKNVQQPPRVVTPVTRPAAPPRVQARMHHLSPQNLSRDFLDIDGANCAIAFGKNHWKTTPMINAVIHTVTGKEMQYKDLMKDPDLGPLFEIGLSNQLGRICQGIREIAGTNTAFFVDLTSIPKDCNITYGKLVCDFKPNKTEKHQVRLMVGGDILDYSGDTATSTADITTFKILINSTLSTKDAKMMMMDINNYYLGTPLPT